MFLRALGFALFFPVICLAQSSQTVNNPTVTVNSLPFSGNAFAHGLAGTIYAFPYTRTGPNPYSPRPSGTFGYLINDPANQAIGSFLGNQISYRTISIPGTIPDILPLSTYLNMGGSHDGDTLLFKTPGEAFYHNDAGNQLSNLNGPRGAFLTGISLRGYFYVPPTLVDGQTHNFQLKLDDGGRMLLGGQVVFDQPGLGVFTINQPLIFTQSGFYAVEVDAYDGFQIDAAFTFNVPAGITFVSLPNFGNLPGLTLTPTQETIAQAIDSIGGTTVTPAGANLIGVLSGLVGNPAALGAALDALAPSRLDFPVLLAQQNATFRFANLADHLATERYGKCGLDTSGLIYKEAAFDPSLQAVHSHLLAWEAPTATTPLMSDIFGAALDPAQRRHDDDWPCPCWNENRWSTYISGAVTVADLASTPDFAHSNYTTGQVELGADYKIDPHWLVGGLVSYSHTDGDLDHSRDLWENDGYTPGLYAAYTDDGWYAEDLITTGYNSYAQDRTIEFPGYAGLAHSNPDGLEFTETLAGGYEFKQGSWAYGPKAQLQYDLLHLNSYREEGAPGANLDLASEDASSLSSLVGGEVRYLATGAVPIVAHFSAEWQHEYLNQERTLQARFHDLGDAGFGVVTEPRSGDSALFQAGCDLRVAPQTGLYLNYLCQTDLGTFIANSVQAGVRVSF